MLSHTLTMCACFHAFLLQCKDYSKKKTVLLIKIGNAWILKVVDILKRNCVNDVKGASNEHGLTVGMGKERQEYGPEKSRVSNVGILGGRTWWRLRWGDRGFDVFYWSPRVMAASSNGNIHQTWDTEEIVALPKGEIK